MPKQAPVLPHSQVAEEVIQAAEKGDFTPTQKLLELLRNPFSDADEVEGASPVAVGSSGAPEPLAGMCMLRVAGKPPQWASKLCVTCSS